MNSWMDWFVLALICASVLIALALGWFVFAVLGDIAELLREVRP